MKNYTAGNNKYFIPIQLLGEHIDYLCFGFFKPLDLTSFFEEDIDHDEGEAICINFIT